MALEVTAFQKTLTEKAESLRAVGVVLVRRQRSASLEILGAKRAVKLLRFHSAITSDVERNALIGGT